MTYKKTIHPQYSEEAYRLNQHPAYGCEAGIWLSHFGHFAGQGHFKMQYLVEHLFVYIIEDGKTHLQLDGQNYLLEKGDLCFFFPGQYKILQEDPNAPLRNIYFNLSGPQARILLETLGISTSQSIYRGDFDQLLKSWVTEVELSFRQTDDASFYPVAGAWLFLEKMRQYLQKSSPKTVPLSCQVADFIEHYFHCHLEINELATRFGVSRTTLYRQFQQTYACSPKDYLDRIRLNKSKKMLQETNLSINEIATACGFESASYFCRAFRNETTQRPTIWRQKIQ